MIWGSVSWYTQSLKNVDNVNHHRMTQLFCQNCGLIFHLKLLWNGFVWPYSHNLWTSWPTLSQYTWSHYSLPVVNLLPHTLGCVGWWSLVTHAGEYWYYLEGWTRLCSIAESYPIGIKFSWIAKIQQAWACGCLHIPTICLIFVFQTL